MGVPKGKTLILDDEYLFNKYFIEMGPGGSVNKLWLELKNKGIRNPATGKPITKSGIWQSITRYKVRNWNVPEVKNAVLKYYIDSGWVLTEEEYRDVISQHAHTVFIESQYETFLRDNPEIPDIR